MAVAGPFTSAHVSALAARAAELERIGEETRNPPALMRAARLYKLAVRIADDINEHQPTAFTYDDLAVVRDELRTLATQTAITGLLGDRRHPSSDTTDSSGDITRLLREIAAWIDQRLASADPRSRFRFDAEPQA